MSMKINHELPLPEVLKSQYHLCQENNGVKSRVENPGCGYGPECISGISEQVWNHGIVHAKEIQNRLHNSKHRIQEQGKHHAGCRCRNDIRDHVSSSCDFPALWLSSKNKGHGKTYAYVKSRLQHYPQKGISDGTGT